MRHRMVLFIACAFFFQTAARADMIEVKKEGIFNGKVVSRDDRQVQLKDAKGTMHRFDKNDVLFLETSEEQAPRPFWDKVKQTAAEFWRIALKAPQAVKKTSDQLTEKFIGKMSKPLDRSVANAKADMLAKTMDDASKSTAEMAKKSMKVDAEINRQTREARDAASSSEQKGRFTSL